MLTNYARERFGKDKRKYLNYWWKCIKRDYQTRILSCTDGIAIESLEL